MSLVTYSELRGLLVYSPDTGEFTWLINKKGSGARIGKQAGTIKPDGRRIIHISGRNYRASRLAWLYMTGDWPVNTVDHINRNPKDDRWENLRDVPHQQNMLNRAAQKNNVSGIKGVCWHKYANRWFVQLTHKGVCVHRSYHVDLNEAKKAHAEAVLRHHGEIGYSDGLTSRSTRCNI